MKKQHRLTSEEEQELIHLTKELIKIPSTVKDGKTIYTYVEHYLKERNIKISNQTIPSSSIEYYNFPNLYVKIGNGKGPKIMLNGHLDTVSAKWPERWRHPPFQAVEEDGKIYGRGAADMKAGCAAAILTLLALQKRKKEIKGELFLSLVFGEEAPFSLGTDILLREFDISDYQLAIIPEPSPLLTLNDYCCFHRRVHKSRFPVAIIGAEGRMVLEIEFHGKAVHASHPTQGINALHDASQLITELSRFNVYSNITRGRGDYVILNIEGGDPTFTVPDYCKILVNRQMVLGENVKSVIREIKKIIRELRLKSTINIYQRQSPDPGLEYRPYVSKNNSYIDLFMEKIVNIDPPEKIENGKKPLGLFNSSNCQFITRSVGDFNLVATRAQIPTIVFGPGGGNIHACNEFVYIHDLVATANHLVNYLMEIL